MLEREREKGSFHTCVTIHYIYDAAALVQRDLSKCIQQ